MEPQPRRIPLWEEICGIIAGHGLQARVKHMCEAYEKVFHTSAMPPALKYFMNQEVDENDLRFNMEFRFPDSNTTQFSTDYPFGTLVHALHEPGQTEDLERILESDDNMNYILRGQAVGEPIQKLISSLVCYWLTHFKLMPFFVSGNKGKIWFRTLVSRLDGTVFLALVNYQRKGHDKLILQIQDISEDYPDYQLSKFFI